MRLPRFLLPWHAMLPWLVAHVAIGLVLVALAGYTWLDQRQTEAARDMTMAQDLLWQEQGLRLHLQTNQNVLENLAYSLAANAIDDTDFNARADALMKDNPEMQSLEFLDATGHRMGGLPVYSSRPSSLVALDDPQVQEAIDGAATLGYAVYSNVIIRDAPVIVLAVPYYHASVYGGIVLAAYSLPELLRLRIPWWMIQRYDLALLDDQGHVVAPLDATVMPGSQLTRTVGVDPLGHELKLRASVRDNPKASSQTWLLGAVFLLLTLLWWMLAMLRRRMLERQAAEVALRDEMGFRSAMEDSLTTGLRAMDRDGRIIYVNPAFCQMVGWSASELLGHIPPMPYWPPEELENCAAAYRAILEGQTPQNGYQLRFMRRNGERFDVRLYSSRLVDGRGEYRGWMASLYDVTEIRREREALAASRKQLLTVLEGLEAAVSVTDEQSGQLLYRNRHHDDLFPLRDEAPCCLVPLIEDHTLAVETRDPVSGRWFHVQRRRIEWVDRRLVWLDIVADVTEVRQYAEDMRLQSEKLQHTARLISMGELASSLAHELNQPLAAISSYSAAAEDMLNAPVPMVEKAGDVLARIGGQARRAGQIIRGIRDFAAKRAPRRENCDLAELLSVPVQLLEPVVRKTQSKVIVEMPDNLPIFQGDSVMLEQVLFNLLKNGIEAMAAAELDAPREITVTASATETELVIAVADRGPGLASPEALFQPFYTTKPDGLGIGLNICRSVIEQHRGQLMAEANPGGGTRFICRLPLAISTAVTEETE
ncbi:PAS domain S-box protein [Silvimonas iriomotensis]|nr:PAS domain S-box protein [Silvimonas iriomotensis]